MNVPKLRFKEFNGEWEEKKLGEVSNIYDGTHQTPNYIKSGIKFVSVEDIKNIENTQKYISEEDFNKNFKIKPQINDILMTRITAGIIGDTSIIKNNNPLGYYVSLALIRKKDDLEVNFLNQYINSRFFKLELNKRIIHVAFPKKINLGDIGECKINYPILKEQEKIGNFLSSVDKKISITEEKLGLFKDYKKGIMQKIFNQELRFKDSNGNDYPEWEEKKLDDIMKVSSSTISQNTLEDNQGEYIIYGATGEIKKIDFYDKEKEYIGIVKDGAGVGRCFYCKEKSSVLATLNYLDIKENNNLKFCYYILNKIDFTKYIVGSSIPHIYFKDYKFEKIQLPCLEEQQKIADFLSSIDNKIDNLVAELENLKEFKKGLLQQMFV